MLAQDTRPADHASFEAIRAYEWAADQEFQVTYLPSNQLQESAARAPQCTILNSPVGRSAVHLSIGIFPETDGHTDLASKMLLLF